MKALKTTIWLITYLAYGFLKAVRLIATLAGIIFLITLMINLIQADTMHNLQALAALAGICILEAFVSVKLAEPMLQKIIRKTAPSATKRAERQRSVQQESSDASQIQHFNPWTDEWYGEGPWWKSW